MTNRVIVCDDEAHITRAISMKLSKAGLTVQWAADGQAGWELIQRERPDVVITDFQMPRLNGLDLIRRMRECEQTRDIPVLLLTAKGFEVDEDELRRELDIAGVVVKPFSPRELLKQVQTLVETARTEA
ncbi:MAG: response regulator [Planctomycetes bacterium]|nr:response regulator [Planctomycetota bacterium]